MKVIETNLEGVLLLEPDVFKDDRGFFLESYSKKRYDEYGINVNFVQDNISKSCKATVRGLHYQAGEFSQGKLCQVILGKVLDVAVDIRFGSPTFGKHYIAELSEDNKRQLWIPAGFAHGFSVISDEAVFHYKCTNYYSKAHERAILFSDSTLAINWQTENPLVSEKDRQAKRFLEIEKDFEFTKE